MNNEMDYGLGIDEDRSILDQIADTDRSIRSGNCSKEYPIANVKIPQSVLIDCPLVRPAKIRASECASCLHFRGVVQVGWSDETTMPWDAKYAIKCGKPLDRKCTSIVSLANTK